MKAVAAGLALAAAVTVGFVRPRLAETYHGIQARSDVYPLPPPAALLAASLGHRSALADMIFANVLVAYGIHVQEKRRLEFAGAYIDAVNALDPKFRDPYRFADTLLVYGPDEPKFQHYAKAREIFERGLQNLPYDTALWLTAGQFLTYLGGPHMPTPELQASWKLAGAKMLARACDLASENEAIPYHCIAAAGLLEHAGEREAAIRSLERIIAVSDDPNITSLALNFLSTHLSERNRERQEHRRTVFRSAWKADLPFVSKDMMLVVGPHTDVARCAGRSPRSDVDCVTSWAAWAAVADPPPVD
jgi:tetratricopeptide (TPR) repeat protein